MTAEEIYVVTEVICTKSTFPWRNNESGLIFVHQLNRGTVFPYERIILADRLNY